MRKIVDLNYSKIQMNIIAAKKNLAKRILETEDKEIINYVKAILDNQSNNWFEELPEEIKVSVERGLRQSAKGESRPHTEVMKKYQKWLKK